MLQLAVRNLLRRPTRTVLTLLGVALAVAVLGSLATFGAAYRAALGTEIQQMGMQLMLVPLGCPYDAAARVIKGKSLDNSLPESALASARQDPNVAVAAPLLMVATPHPDEGRTDLWVGLDEAGLKLKPWWHVKSGVAWFSSPDSVILGSEAAAIEMRAPGDRFYCPDAGKTLRVAGVLDRSGTSDDSLFFVPLATAQTMFHQQGRLTAVAVRLKDPEEIATATTRLQNIPGAQVVTMAEMMGTFLNLVGSMRTLLAAIGAVALAAGAMGVFNTMFGAVLESLQELAMLRAMGASRGQVFQLVLTQALLLGLAAAILGAGVSAGAGVLFSSAIRETVPLAPAGNLLQFSPAVAAACLLTGLGIGALSGLYPAWLASRQYPLEALRS